MAKNLYKHVVNLEERLTRTRFIKIGGLKPPVKSKGEHGNWYYPADQYPGFKITFTERNTQKDDRNYFEDTETTAALKGNYPQYFEGDALKQLPVMVPFDDPYRNFTSFYRSWDNKLGTSRCEGNGEEAQRLKGNGPERDIITCNPMTCPIFQGKKCVLNFSFYCRLPFIEKASFGECAEYRTQSHETAENILNGMKYTKGLAGGILAGVPMRMKMIARSQKADIDQKTGQQKYSRISYNVGLVPDCAEMEEIIEIAQTIREQRALVEGKEVKLIEPAKEETPDDIALHQREFGQRSDGDEREPVETLNLHSEKTSEAWDSVQELMDTINVLSEAYWPNKKYADRQVEIGNVKAQGAGALISLYEDMMAAKETGGEDKDGPPKESLPKDHNSPPTENDSASPPSSEPLTADLMCAHFPEVTNYHHMRQYMAKMAKDYNGLPAADKKRVQAAKKKRENEFAAEGQTSSDQEKMFNQ